MISKEKQFIFIHNFKTGGTSIEKKLGHFENLEVDVQDHRTLRDIQTLTERSKFLKLTLYALKKGKLQAVSKHLKAAFKPELTASQFNQYYKFTFVRNSWARLYSWYYNILKDDRLRDVFGIESKDYSFEDFISNNFDHTKFSQLNYIKDKSGMVNMDFIGRFENLQEDFTKVCNHLNIEDSQLPKLLHTKYDSYTIHYTLKTRELVYNLYKEEIDYFGFKFGE